MNLKVSFVYESECEFCFIDLNVSFFTNLKVKCLLMNLKVSFFEFESKVFL